MQDLIESIRSAVDVGATAEQKAAGAVACRTLLTALEAEGGKPMVLTGAPTPHPLARIDPTQALDLLIARLTAALPAEPSAAAGPKDQAVRFAFVKPNPNTTRR